ncbi:MAG: 5-formyltetrahydrofolate cyclo-ligase [Lachnospiraceae bacterium]|nr:5-formyltetrahydrofolate cyclo-ligase [Lachnospiraceae bacterium]
MNQNDKKAFRKAMLAKRDAIPYENRIEADKARNELIRSWDVYQNAELLLFYVSYRSEADMLQLLKEALEAGRDVAVPKVVGTEMVFYRITEFSQLIEGYKGILEPDTERCEAVTEMNSADDGRMQSVTKPALPEHTILFVPGCAFDKLGGRMGYGGGFYDRFMEKYPDVLRVALAYEEQLVEEVPQEAHDKTVDVITTGARVIQIVKGV